MKVREFAQSALRHWPVGAVALVAAAAFVLLGQAQVPLSAQTAAVKSPVTTVIHYPNHTPLPCYNSLCLNEHVGPEGTSVHDKATVTSGDVTLSPTGNMRFAFYRGTLHCMGTPSSNQTVLLTSGGGVATAESSATGPLLAGDYSYRTAYVADAAARALGFANTPGPCEQLRIIRVDSNTVVHHSDGLHTPLDCFNPANCPGGGQKAPLGSTIHDLDTVNSGDAARTPTGFVRFARYDNELECRGIPSFLEDVTVSGSGAVTTAESSDFTPPVAGVYSYKAIYFPDAAAIALGLGSSPANCEQLLIE